MNESGCAMDELLIGLALKALPPNELAEAERQFVAMTVENARRLLRFWQVRS